MRERYPRYGRSALALAALLLAVGAGMAYFQLGEFLATGRVVAGWSSDRGTTYGPKFYLVYPALELLFGVLAAGTASIRIEVDDEAIRQFGMFGRLVSRVQWADVKSFRRTGTIKVVDGPHGSKHVYRTYELRGTEGKITFDERLNNLSGLIHTIRKRLPADAVNELPQPTN